MKVNTRSVPKDILSFDHEKWSVSIYTHRHDITVIISEGDEKRIEERMSPEQFIGLLMSRKEQQRDDATAKLTALRTAAEGASKALEAILNYRLQLPAGLRPQGELALAALRAELDQPASNASNSPTASRDK